MKKLFYKWMMEYRCHSLSYDLEKIIKTIETYNLCIVDDYCNEPIINAIDTYKIFKDIENDKISYNIFMDNIHIRLEKSSKEQVYSIHIKNQNEDWIFNKIDDNINHSVPDTSTYRIFISYDVPVLNITRAHGNTYIHGNWDMYVYKTLKKLFTYINYNDKVYSFNESYKSW